MSVGEAMAVVELRRPSRAGSRARSGPGGPGPTARSPPWSRQEWSTSGAQRARSPKPASTSQTASGDAGIRRGGRRARGHDQVGRRAGQRASNGSPAVWSMRAMSTLGVRSDQLDQLARVSSSPNACHPGVHRSSRRSSSDWRRAMPSGVDPAVRGEATRLEAASSAPATASSSAPRERGSQSSSWPRQAASSRHRHLAVDALGDVQRPVRVAPPLTDAVQREPGRQHRLVLAAVAEVGGEQRPDRRGAGCRRRPTAAPPCRPSGAQTSGTSSARPWRTASSRTGDRGLPGGVLAAEVEAELDEERVDRAEGGGHDVVAGGGDRCGPGREVPPGPLRARRARRSAAVPHGSQKIQPISWWEARAASAVRLRQSVMSCGR